MIFLFVCPNVPPLIRTRPYNLLRVLAANGHHLTLATVWEREAERPALESLAAVGVRILSAPLRRGRIGRNLIESLARGQPPQDPFGWEAGVGAQQLRGTTAGGSLDIHER